MLHGHSFRVGRTFVLKQDFFPLITFPAREVTSQCCENNFPGETFKFTMTNQSTNTWKFTQRNQCISLDPHSRPWVVGYGQEQGLAQSRYSGSSALSMDGGSHGHTESPSVNLLQLTYASTSMRPPRTHAIKTELPLMAAGSGWKLT